VAGLILVNDDTNATRVSAYDATGSVLNLWGYVNRITA